MSYLLEERTDWVSVRFLLDGDSFAGLGPQPKQGNEQLVLFLGELFDGTIPGLLEDSVSDRSLQLGSDSRIPEGIEHRQQPVEDTFQEMLDPACAPAEVELKIGADDSPA